MGERALTLHQPYASLVAVGAKTVETRRQRTNYRGPLLIHAGKRTVDFDGIVLWQNAVAGRSDLPAPVTPMGNLPLGAVVASCRLIDCVPMVQALPPQSEWREPWTVLTVAPWPILTTWRGFGSAEPVREYASERAFGDFSPGRWAWLLEDVKPTTERCPRCWGAGVLPAWEIVADDGEYRRSDDDRACSTCTSDEQPFIGEGRCAPVPMSGRQGLWIPNEQDWSRTT